MMILCIFLFSLSLFNVEGVLDVVPKPQKNKVANDLKLFLVDPNELSKPEQMADEITVDELAEMMSSSGSGDMSPMLIAMGLGNNSRGTDDVIIGSVHSMVSIVAFLLNVIVIMCLCFPTTVKKMTSQSSTSLQSFIILQISCTSLVLVVTMMTSASSRLSMSWYFGSFCCKLNNWLKAFGIISQSYFCTLLLVELYLQLRHSSFIHRYTTCYLTRVKILIVFIGWMVAFIFSYPFWVRTTYYTSGSSTYCSINTFDVDDSDDLPIDDYATVLKNTGGIVIKLPNMTNTDDDDDIYVDYEYDDSNTHECHMEETSFSFRFWYASLVIFGYFIPLAIIIAIFAVLKCTTPTSATSKNADLQPVSSHSKSIVYFITLIFVICWLPLSIYKTGKVFTGLPLYREQCLLARDIGSIMGYFSCLALPAAVVMYMVNIQRRNSNNIPSSLKDEKKQLDDCDVITNRCDDDSEKGIIGDWQ